MAESLEGPQSKKSSSEMTVDPFQSQTTISWMASHRVITRGLEQTHRSNGPPLQNKTFSDRRLLLGETSAVRIIKKFITKS